MNKSLLNTIDKTIERLTDLRSKLEKQEVKKTAVKTVKKTVVKKAVKRAKPTKTQPQTTASQSPKPLKRWRKFDMANLPKVYSFMRVVYKTDAKSTYGRFLHTALSKERNIYIDVATRDKKTVRIPFQNIKQAYIYA